VLRNLRRYVTRRPPLLDRFSGFDAPIAERLRGRRYRVAVVEHFWAAPYARALREHADRLVLDLHNIESRWHATSAVGAGWPEAAMHRAFAEAYARLEREWLQQFDDLLVTSRADAERIEHPRVHVYPNTIPFHEEPRSEREHAIAFTGNLEYAPNIAAVRWFAREIWPEVRSAEPGLEWRLVGRNPDAIAPLVRGVPGVKIVGPVADAIEEIGRAKVAVVPLRAGSGTRFKILEAWAAATPVVSTALGAEGLDAVDGAHLVIAESAREFAEAVVRVVRGPGRLGRCGREFYLERFTTEAGWRVLSELL
jgi:glycosyltransferase involved in cell wall biosynthesis